MGCGNGSQAHYIEKMGFDVTAADIVNVLKYDVKNFVINDALDSKLTKTYDIIMVTRSDGWWLTPCSDPRKQTAAQLIEVSQNEAERTVT